MVMQLMELNLEQNHTPCPRTTRVISWSTSLLTCLEMPLCHLRPPHWVQHQRQERADIRSRRGLSWVFWKLRFRKPLHHFTVHCWNRDRACLVHPRLITCGKRRQSLIQQSLGSGAVSSASHGSQVGDSHTRGHGEGDLARLEGSQDGFKAVSMLPEPQSGQGRSECLRELDSLSEMRATPFLHSQGRLSGKASVLANPKIVLKALHMIQTDLSPQVECTASLVQHTMSMLEKEEKLKSLQNQVIEPEKELQQVLNGKYRHLVTGQPAASSSQEREAMDIMSRLTASEYKHLRQITAERGRASLEEEELIPGPATPTSLTSWTLPRTPDS